MAFTLDGQGGYQLFNSGWTGTITTAKLYSSDDLITPVATESISFSYSGGSISIPSSVTFTISSPVNNVAFVTVGTTSRFFKQDLTNVYDFPTAGTLTITSWTIGISGSSVTTDGKSELFQNGWASSMNYARLFRSGSTLVGTLGSLTFSATTTGSGRLTSDDSSLTFSITAVATSVDTYELGNQNVSVFTPYFSDSLRDSGGNAVSYNFNFDGTLSMDALYLASSAV